MNARWPAVLFALPLLASPPVELKRTCTRCHPLAVIRAQRLTREEWNDELRKMEHLGAAIRNREALLNYLAAKYGKASGKQTVK